MGVVMNKKALLLPALSTLLFAPVVLSQTAAADSVASQETPVVAGTASVDTAKPSAVAATTEVSSEENATPDSATPAVSTETPVDTTKESDEVADKTADTAISEPTQPSDTVTILHTNDMHGRILEEKDKSGNTSVIGMAKLGEIVKEERAKGTTLVLDAGDAFQGLPISNSTEGADMASLMNEIGYDAMTVGNHEFDFGLDRLKEFKTVLNFPIISSNIYVNDVRLLDAYTIVDKTPDVSGDEFVVIGVSTPETATKTHPKNVEGVVFKDPITEVEAVISQVESNARAEGKTYHNYIILSHLGVDTTTPENWRGSTLAETLSKNENLAGKNVVVIDGHSHTLLSKRYGDNTAYNQTGSYLANVGKITLNSTKILSTGDISAADATNLVPSVDLSKQVEAIKAKYEAKNSKVIREQSPVTLAGDRENVRVRETNQGNAITDAMWQYGQTGFAHKTNLAVMNGGGIRETLKKDQPITAGNVIAVLPFGNSIAQITVTGQQISEMFHKSLGSVLQQKDGQNVLDENGQPLLEPSGGFLHVSGARVYYDTMLPSEDRILKIEIKDPETGEYNELDTNATYYLATNDFQAAGGDGYTMLGGAREEGPSLDSIYADFLKTADLTQYEVVNPNSRLISISKENFGKLSNDEANQTPNSETDRDPVVTPRPVSQETTPKQTSETVVATGSETVAVPVSYTSNSTVSSTALPKTGDDNSLYLGAFGVSLMALVGYGTVRKRKEMRK